MGDYYTPSRGLMGLIHPEGVLMLPKGRRPEGSIKTPEGPEIPMSPRAGGVIITFLSRWMGWHRLTSPGTKGNFSELFKVHVCLVENATPSTRNIVIPPKYSKIQQFV